MKKVLTILIILSMIFVSGCIRAPGEPVPIGERSMDESETVVQDIEQTKTIKKTVKVNEPVVEETPEPEVKVIEQEPNEYMESDVEKPDCDGRLIPTYNFRNELTGYRCDTNAENFECPGHRAGDTWKEGCNTCTCNSDGSIACSDEDC